MMSVSRCRLWSISRISPRTPPAIGSTSPRATFGLSGAPRVEEVGMNTETAYRTCEDITRREAKNFGYGIRLLRVPERHALSAVYALARRIDDIGDGDAPAAQRLEELAAVRKDLEPISTDTDDPVLAGVAHAAARYGLPMAAFGELIDGCVMDVEGAEYST